MRLSGRRLLLVTAVVACAATTGPPAQAARTAGPTLVVDFSATGDVSVSLPSGSPVGTTAGAPTAIAAGAYTLVLNGPGGCTPEPLFQLKGPGVDVTSDMLGSEVTTYELYATFQPNATYTWRTDWNQSIVYSFVASGTPVASSSAAAGTSSSTAGSGVSGVSSPVGQNVGHTSVPFRGKLAVAVDAAGKLAVTLHGQSVTTLKNGRYTLAVTDRSRTSGLVLRQTGRKSMTVSGTAFVGSRTVAVDLTAGLWSFVPRAGRQTLAILVS